MCKELIISGVILCLLDIAYITCIQKTFRSQIFAVQSSPMSLRYLGVIMTYVFLFLGVYYFIIRNHRSIIDAFLLGIFVYGVYDLTNYSTLREWKIELVLMDTLWGGVLFSLTTFFTYKLLDIIK